MCLEQKYKKGFYCQKFGLKPIPFEKIKLTDGQKVMVL